MDIPCRNNVTLNGNDQFVGKQETITDHDEAHSTEDRKEKRQENKNIEDRAGILKKRNQGGGYLPRRKKFKRIRKSYCHIPCVKAEQECLRRNAG